VPNFAVGFKIHGENRLRLSNLSELHCVRFALSLPSVSELNIITILIIKIQKQNEKAKIDGTENGQKRKPDETGLAQ
jgi:hypothetical protein